MNTEVVEILPNLWLSGHKYAKNKGFLRSKNIKLIINCSTNIDFVDGLDDIKKIRIPVNDSLQEKDIQLLTKYLPKTSLLIEKYFNNLDPVLVHCYAGKQRSATVITSFIMKQTNLDIKMLIALIQMKKSNAFRPCINFMQSLKDYQTFLNTKN